MRVSTIILTIGIPGAGKTTWVQDYVSAHHAVHVVSSDEIRKELTGTVVCDPRQSPAIHDEARRRVKDILDNPEKYGHTGCAGPVIIVDSTNVELEEWIKYRDLHPTLFLAKIFDVTPAEAMARQAMRVENRIVPQDVVEKKWKQLQENKKYIPFIFNMIIDKAF